MNAAKKGLGRGLSALFGDIDNKSISSDKVSNTIPIADLSRNKYQPRTIFDEEKLSELSKSINENGVIQPIAVRPNKYEKGKYEIIKCLQHEPCYISFIWFPQKVTLFSIHSSDGR